MTWPDTIWNAPALRGLDARARADIEAAGSLRALSAGDRVYASGEPADAFFVVERGEVHVRAVARGDEDMHVVREARRGDAFGEEATLRAGGSRRMEAVCASEEARVAVIPAPVFARAAERGGGGEALEDRRRLLRRAATLDLLRTMAFTRRLSEEELEILLDASEHAYLARGDALYREGDAATHVYFVADGRLQVQTEDEGRLHVRAYVGRGDVIGEAEIASGERRRASVVAAGASWVVGVPRAAFRSIAARHGDLLEAVRRVVEDEQALQLAVAQRANTTQHVMRDLYRLEIARSLLVIDQEACVRCGHCAWSCASTHDDGVSRLVRRGDKIVTATSASVASLLLPNSCQHCENPACMPDCPTGAIGRDPRGEVFIREDLCTGCGACAKGCPWDNIQMAPASDREGLVAVKCDLCKGKDAGPACVAACPTEAIQRIKPTDALPEVRAVARKKASAPGLQLVARARPAWPTVGGAALASVGASLAFAALPRAMSGVACGVAMAALVAYAVVKRWVVARRPGVTARGQYVAHLALGVVTVGAVIGHAGGLPPHAATSLTTALLTGLLALGAVGAAGAMAYVAVPARLSRIERGGALPEDLPAHARELDERIYRELSGKSELVKTVFAKMLRPYAESAVVGPARLVASGRSLRAEEERVRAGVDAVLEGRGADKLEGLDALVRAVVERRALRAQRALLFVLRGWLVAHVVLAVVVVALMALHATFALVYR